MGGTNTILTGYKLTQKGVNVIAIPKAIENDIPGTESAFGFDSAVNTATEALDKLHSTAESTPCYDPPEAMGRRRLVAPLESGLSMEQILSLSLKFHLTLNLSPRSILNRKNSGKGFSIICVSEGCRSVDGTINPDAATIIQEDKQVIKGIVLPLPLNLKNLQTLKSGLLSLVISREGGNPLHRWTDW